MPGHRPSSLLKAATRHAQDLYIADIANLDWAARIRVALYHSGNPDAVTPDFSGTLLLSLLQVTDNFAVEQRITQDQP
jgi:hypothetical protein